MGLIIYYGLKEEQIIPNDSNYTIGFFWCKLPREYPMLLYNWVLNYKKCEDVDLMVKIDMSIKINDKIYKYLY